MARRIRPGGLLAILLGLVSLLPAPGTAVALEMRLVPGDDPAFTVVELSGRFERSDAAAVQGFLSRLPRGRPVAVHLSSSGGVIDEAIALGRYFHRTRIRTYVRGASHCLSACAIAFLGGRDRATGAPFRAKALGAQLGLHNFRFASAERDYTVADLNAAVAHTQRQILEIAGYFSEVGADMELLALMLETPNAESGVIANDTALSLGIHLLDEATGRITGPEPVRRRLSEAR